MKKRWIWLTELTLFALWFVFTSIVISIVYEDRRAADASAELGQVFLSVLPILLLVLVLALLVGFFVAYFVVEGFTRSVEGMAKTATLSKRVDATYPELQPLADVLNKRNEDMTKKLAELSEEKDLAEKAQRSKDDFVANITHEMNTPLTAIRGYSELLAAGVLDEAQTKDAADVLVKQSDRLSKLIARIINYNELDNDELPSYEVDVSSLLHELLEGLAPDIAKKNERLILDVEEGVTVKSRQERVNELLGNLLRNAIRYNREGGELRVALKRTEKGSRFTVSDTGVGIAEENLDRIFERFFTVDKSHSGKGGGFGLGLAMVKKICRRAGWIVNVHSVEGQGTTFTVDFK